MYQTMNASGGYVMTGLSDLASAVTPVTKVSTKYASGSWASETSTDTFWLMSYSELFGENKGWIPKYYKNEGSQYAWCTTNVTNPTGNNTAIKNIDKTRAGSSPAVPSGYYDTRWWGRSSYIYNTYSFGSVDTSGDPYDYYGIRTNRYYGVVPAFSL